MSKHFEVVEVDGIYVGTIDNRHGGWVAYWDHRGADTPMTATSRDDAERVLLEQYKLVRQQEGSR